MKKEKKFFNNRQVNIEAGSFLSKSAATLTSIEDRELLIKSIGEPTLTGWNSPILSLEEEMRLLAIEIERMNQNFDGMMARCETGFPVTMDFDGASIIKRFFPEQHKKTAKEIEWLQRSERVVENLAIESLLSWQNSLV